MRRRITAVVATFCVAACATVQSNEEGASSALLDLQRSLPERAAQAEAAARQILEDPELQSPSIQRSATHVLAAALADQGVCNTLLPDANRTVSAPTATQRDWRFAFAFNYECEDYQRAAELLSGLRLRYPDDIAGLPNEMVFRTAIRSEDAGLLAFIVNGGWRPDDPAIDISELRLALIRAQLANGNQLAATEVARDFADSGTSDLGSVVVFLSDQDFAPIIDANPEYFAFSRIIDRFLTNGFEMYSTNPQRLSALNALASTLNSLGRSDEALTLVEDALARKSDFTDRDTVVNWTYQLRSDLREQLGLGEEALADLEVGAAQGEDGRVNVSQRLNRAWLLFSRGEAERALSEAQAVAPTHLSPYGRSVRRNIVICSYAELGRAEEMQAALAEAAAAAIDSYSGLQSAAMCANDLDLAAEAFRHRLESASERRSAILSMQGFAGEPPPQQWQDASPLYSRSDVRAAIEAAMRIQAFPMRRPN